MPPSPRWFHIEFNTFGTWLPGDPRGFRDHDHRIHSSGDYRNPPPRSEHQALHRWVSKRLQQQAVQLTAPQREEVGRLLIHALNRRDMHVLALAVSSNHAHALIAADSDDSLLRKAVGNAKRQISHAMRASIPGSLWQRKIGVRTVRDERHLHNAAAYIARHADEGAWVWESPRFNAQTARANTSSE